MTRFDQNEPTARVSRHEIEVSATPAEVWQAIATGPGISAWFVPAAVEGEEGGRIVTDHGPFGESEGVVTAWEPPRRFAYEERDWNPEAPDAPPWATEVLVQAHAGGTCVVRLVSGFFADGQGWEEHLEGTDEGWSLALQSMRLYLSHFAGLPVASMMAVGTVPGDRDATVSTLLRRLGLDGVGVAETVRLPSDAPPTAGVVEGLPQSGVTLRANEPTPGLVHVGAFDMGGTTTVMVRGYLFGEGAEAVAERDAPRWTAWLSDHLDGFAEMRGA